MHIIPELADSQRLFAATTLLGEFERHICLVALAGLVVFNALERLVRSSRKSVLEKGADRPPASVYTINIASFMAYNFLTAYLLVHRIMPGALSLAIFVLVFALHFLVVDFGPRKDHSSDYDKSGRYLLTAALAGGIVLNVLKEELPEERKGRILPFVAGVIGYGALLIHT